MLEERPVTYDFRSIERAWQDRWERDGIYRTDDADPRPKYYVLEMLPYPSGDLHVGHAKNYTLGDAVARMMRMRGFNVVHPMGWDAFGLPAENAAIQRGIAPDAWTRSNIANMERQIRLMGAGYDWSREFATCDPEYYRWNQWFFLRMYDAGLAYKRKAPVNWCPVDQTVLANEQVVDGCCWRCGSVVERRNLAQWFFKITQYADRLLAGIDRLDGWPQRIRTMQRNWIGRSEGVTFALDVEGIAGASIDVYTTRVDTIFGVTFVAVAAEHPVVATIAAAHPDRRAAIEAFGADLRTKSELERTQLMEKSGIFSGAYALNPLSGDRVPIWITNYVLADYGTGAVMGVPGHDERDFDFARRHDLPVVRVVGNDASDTGPLDAALTGDGILVASGDYDGMTSDAARTAIGERLEALGIGKRTVNYRFRDWLVSRQRYWGTPIPMVVCPVDGEVPLPDDALPVILPPNVPITGQGSPLARDPDFLNTTCPRCGGPATRDPDTMDTFVDSSWYYVRYLDPHNATAPFDTERASTWMPVDQYIGGAEHAVMHLLYARFFYKFMVDRGYVRGDDEPFRRLFNQGTLLRNGEKMSKSRGNVVGIDETVETYGVDAMRLFLLKAAPPEDSLEWTDEGIVGRVRFIDRVWRACEPLTDVSGDLDIRTLPEIRGDAQRELVRALHMALKSGSDETDSRRFHYNTTTARLDELVNLLTRATRDPALADDPAVRYVVAALPIVLAPFAPHLADELWSRLGHTASVHLERWIDADPVALAVATITLVVQVNGKVRARIETAPDVSESDAVALALAEAPVAAQLDGKTIRKQIFVPGKLLNIVAA